MWRFALESNFRLIIFKWRMVPEEDLCGNVSSTVGKCWPTGTTSISLWPFWLYKRNFSLSACCYYFLFIFLCIFWALWSPSPSWLGTGNCSWISTETILSARLNLEVASQWKNMLNLHERRAFMQICLRHRWLRRFSTPPKPFSPPPSLLFAVIALNRHSWGVYADQAFFELL